MNKFFKPEDFTSAMCTSRYIPENVAELANAKLEKLIESWPVVYGIGSIDKAAWTSAPINNAEHKARLAFIEPLLREPCKHEPVWENQASLSTGLISPTYFGNAHCHKCGIELIATWKIKE